MGMNRSTALSYISLSNQAKAAYSVSTVPFFQNNPAEDSNINIISNPTRKKKKIKEANKQKKLQSNNKTINFTIKSEMNKQ